MRIFKKKREHRLDAIAALDTDAFSPKDVARMLDISWDDALALLKTGEEKGYWRRRTSHGYFYTFNEKK